MSPPLALASVAHAVETTHLDSAQRPRAKAIARPARVVSARIFSAACEASGLSNRGIARWLDVDERRVREMRKGEAPVTLEHLASMPPSVEHVAAIGLIEHAKSRSLVTR